MQDKFIFIIKNGWGGGILFSTTKQSTGLFLPFLAPFSRDKRCFVSHPVLAGEAGFEPTHDGVKVRCLTAWLLPKIKNGVGYQIRTDDLQCHKLAP